MAPPGMPKTTSTPTASSDRTSDWAPVTRIGVPAGGAGLGAAGLAVPPAGLPAERERARDVALVIVLPRSYTWCSRSWCLLGVLWSSRSVCSGRRRMKKPPPTTRSDEGPRVDAARFTRYASTRGRITRLLSFCTPPTYPVTLRSVNSARRSSRMARRRGAPATPPTGPGTAPGTIHQVSEKSEPQPSTPERPPVKEATFRMPRVAVVAAFLAMVSATPFAWSSWWLATVYLLPIGFAVWVLRTQTTVDATGLTARTVFGSRFIGWGELTGLSVVSDAKVFAVLADKEQVRLPGVRA